MYGKEVTVNGIMVFVLGVPSMTEAEWIKQAKRVIKARINTV